MAVGYGNPTGFDFNVHRRDRLWADLSVLAVAGLLLEIWKGEISMQTLTAYWYAIKYWAGGADWETAFEVACKVVYWPETNRRLK